MSLLIAILLVAGASLWLHSWIPVIALGVILLLMVVCCTADDISDQR